MILATLAVYGAGMTIRSLVLKVKRLNDIALLNKSSQSYGTVRGIT